MRPPRLRPWLLLVATSSYLVLLVAAAVTAPKSLPNVDYSSLGTVGIVGSYAGLDFYDSSNVNSSSSSSSSSTSAFIRRTSSGSMSIVAHTNAGGSISALCQSSSTGAIYIGGSFSSIGSVTTSNLVAFNPNTSAFTTYSSPPNGQVLSLDCDDEGSRLIVGGLFSSPSNNAAVYPFINSSSTTPSEVLDGGFNAAVRSIDRQGNSVFFAGDFTVSYGNSTLNSSSTSSTNTTGAMSNFRSIGSSLVPVAVTSNAATFASPTTYRSGFGLWSYLFCPDSDDGPGSSWLLTDGSNGFLTVNLGRSTSARGVRIGNTFFHGRGTQNFHIISLPNSTPIPLTYSTNPLDVNSATAQCTDSCTLSHDENVPFQDFLFPEDTTLSGVQMVITSYYGTGAGLHLFQLLSSGSYAYAADSVEQTSSTCTSGLGAQSGTSSTTSSGNWNSQSVAVDSVPGASDTVMTSSQQGSTVTWTPYVTADGSYNISVFTPGCTASAVACSQRSTVQVTVQPGGQTTTIDQNTPTDLTSLVYSGQLTTSQTVTVTLTNTGSGTAIADAISLSAANPAAPRSNSTGLGRGLYEWVQDGTTGAFGDGVSGATSVNTTNATSFDTLSRTIAGNGRVNAVVSTSSVVFAAGDFTYTSAGSTTSLANIVSYSGPNTAAPAVPNGGLNHAVYSIVEFDGWLYCAGAFDSSADGTVTGLNGIARWNYQSTGTTQWQSLSGSGGLGTNNTNYIFYAKVDNLDYIIAIGTGSGSGEHFAAYNVSSSSWASINAGLVIGSLSSGIEDTVSSKTDQSLYLAGDVSAVFGCAAPGSAVIQQQGSSGLSQLVPVNYTLSNAHSTTASSHLAMSWLSVLDPRSIVKGLKDRVVLAPRAESPVSVDIPYPGISAGGMEVYTGTFWQNGTSLVAILGGEFETTDGVVNLGTFKQGSNGNLSTLPGLTAEGSVSSLTVIDDNLWVGGNITLNGGTHGLAVYDLVNSSTISLPNVTAYDGSTVTVNFIGSRTGNSKSNIIVAGAFQSIGALPCYSICQWDSSTQMWSAVGAGLQGVVSSADFAGHNNEFLVVAGTFEVNNTAYHVAKWDFNEQIWSSIGESSDLPGPATAISVDDFNINKIFVAGASDNGGDPYLLYWNGTAWADINQGNLERGSGVQQLLFVPVENDHDNNNIVEANRMLMVSGSLLLSDGIGNVSTALFDGKSWHGYLLSATSSGGAGTIASLFYSATGFRLSSSKHLAVGLVILISIAVSLGIVFLLVLIGLFIALRHRQREEQNSGYPVPIPVQDDAADDSASRHRPTSLLATLNAATVMMAEKDKSELSPKGMSDQSPTSSIGEDTRMMDASVGIAAAGAGAAAADAAASSGGFGNVYSADDDDGEQFEQFEAFARYSFDAEREGELSLRTNDPILVLDTSDTQWWLAQSQSTGERGVVPAACLL